MRVLYTRSKIIQRGKMTTPKAVIHAAAVLAACSVSSSAAMAQAISSGTGFAVEKGVVVTNNHVVTGCDVLEVVSSSGRHPVTLVDAEPKVDLAILRVPTLNANIARIRSRPDLQLGEPVSVFGFPLSGALSSGGNFTSGLVSALQGLQNSSSSIQIAAPVQPGNSGGPLLDASGLVVGVVQAKLDALGVLKATGDIPQNVNFAIAPRVLSQFLTQQGIPVPDVEAGAELSSTKIATTAQSFTYRVECFARGQQKSPAADRVPTQLAPTAPPVPTFESTEARQEYLRWLNFMSAMLQLRLPDKQARDEFLQTVWYESKRAGLNSAIVLSTIESVSSFRRYAVAENGARGLMQVNPTWSKRIGDGDAGKLFHMQTNLRFGCVILRQYLDDNKGDVVSALTKYLVNNMGLSPKEASLQANKIHVGRHLWMHQ